MRMEISLFLGKILLLSWALSMLSFTGSGGFVVPKFFLFSDGPTYYSSEEKSLPVLDSVKEDLKVA